MQTQTTKTTPGLPPKKPLAKWLIPAVSAAAIVAVAVIAALLFAGGSDQPDVATTVPNGPQSSALELVDELVVAVNAADLDRVLEILSPRANCDVVAPGTEVETCEGFWGTNIALGGELEIECLRQDQPYQCTIYFTSDAHEALGYGNFRVRNSFPIDVDENGRLITEPFSGTSQTFFGTNAVDFRMWAYMQERYPDLNVDRLYGVNPNTAEGGAAMLEAARELNDPIRLSGELQTAFETLDFDNLGGLAVANACSLVGATTHRCSDVALFLRSLNAELTVDCTGRTGVENEIVCPVTLVTDIHRTLGSGSTVADATIRYRGGTIERVSFDQSWSDDQATSDGFFADAMTQDGLFDLFDGDRPVFTGNSADAWLAFATSFDPGS